MDREQALTLIGRTVSLSYGSGYAHQIGSAGNNRGKIKEVETQRRGSVPVHWLNVQFENGYNNSYHFHDLVFEQDFQTNKEAATLLKKEGLT